MDYRTIIDSTEESMKWHFFQLRGRQVKASIMGNCVSKSLHRESADEVRVSCAKQNNRSGVGSARAWLVHSQSWWRCCRSARWRMEDKSILFAMDTTILTTLQQWQWQHCNNDSDTPTTRPPSPPIKKTQKFPFPEPPGNPCALCVCVPAFSKMSVALFLLVLRPSRTLGCWLGSSRTLPVHPELAPVFHQPQRATHVIRLSGATSERGKWFLGCCTWWNETSSNFLM